MSQTPLNGWLKVVVSGIFVFVIGAASGLVAYGQMTGKIEQQNEAQEKAIIDNAMAIRLNTAAIAALAKDQSAIATNIEWIRKTLERNPNR